MSASGRGANRASEDARAAGGPSLSLGGLMQARRLTATDVELAVLCEALRECLAAELLSPGSVAIARELLDKLDASSPAPSTTTRPVLQPVG
jgi:hypothetical protein